MEYIELTKLMASKRIEAGVSIEEMAQHLNCGVDIVRCIEAGNRDTNMDVLIQYVAYLKLYLVFTKKWPTRFLYFKNYEEYRQFYIKEYPTDVIRWKVNLTYEDLHPEINAFGAIHLMDLFGYCDIELLTPDELEAKINERKVPVHRDKPTKKCRLKPEPPLLLFFLATFVSIASTAYGMYQWVNFILWVEELPDSHGFFISIFMSLFFVFGITIGTLIVAFIVYELAFVCTCALFGYGPGTESGFLIRFDYDNLKY